ncbi:DUF58 domain-containing protein [Neptunomonas antarctica]|uniref:Uncharacterized conserved protein, DUF58 family, contains vWF domain n=1 Tax=Neptunomonas antarctica TaxID=619304 RepID=A0A1N7NP28_9GAMM|nr:DUF58 domain-containing protein [Neptunomonas antarctica]SIT00010.1 Uncharacterized conserved protein, DUF58 family, contains vWF domain [Neptunomonas antarctica]
MLKQGIVREWIKSWLVNRYPPEQTIKLTQSRIYILPTLAGMAYSVVAMLVLLLSINYQNNLAYAVCFTLLSVFITAILHTYANLSGVKITALLVEPVFAGDVAHFRYQLYSAREIHQLTLCFKNHPTVTVDLQVNNPVKIEIPFLCGKRGWQHTELVEIRTLYPLGLFRAWSWLRFEQRALVYPKPICGGEIEALNSGGDPHSAQGRKGDDDFHGFTRYHSGVSKNRIAWKSFAKGQGLHVKEYQGQSGEDIWLDWNAWPALEVEERLSRLCYWSKTLSQRHVLYGLRLPGCEILPATGDAHKVKVLRLLALHGGEA